MRVHRGARFLGIVVVAVGLMVAGPHSASAQSRGQLFATITDQSGQPVLDMRAEEFVIQEDGVPCTVLEAQPGTTPMKIALLVDNGDGLGNGGALNPMRTALAGFLDELSAEHEVGLYTIGRQVQQRVEFTTDRVELQESVESIFPDNGAGVVMVDGMMETWNRRFDPDDSWPVFVVVLAGSAETSAVVSDDVYNGFINTLMRRSATVHTVLLSSRGSSFNTQLAIALTENTGGVYRAINTGTALEGALGEVVTEMTAHFDEMSTRYRLVYERPTDEPGEEIAAGVARPGVTMQLFADRSRAEQ